MSTILSNREDERIVEAIKQAELNTSGEIKVHIDMRCKDDVEQRCLFLFNKLKLNETQQRNGILFYLAVKDHKFAVMGDEGINNIVEVTQNEWMRRMKDMESINGGGISFYGEMPDSYTLMLNTNNPIIAGLADKSDEERATIIQQVYDLARLSKNLLKGKDLSEFVKRNMNNI